MALVFFVSPKYGLSYKNSNRKRNILNCRHSIATVCFILNCYMSAAARFFRLQVNQCSRYFQSLTIFIHIFLQFVCLNIISEIERQRELLKYFYKFDLKNINLSTIA